MKTELLYVVFVAVLVAVMSFAVFVFIRGSLRLINLEQRPTATEMLK